METESIKRDRMHLRLDATSKAKLERAAAFAGKTVSEFVVSNALNAADQVIAEHEMITLADRDWQAFFEALVNPPKPSKNLRSAFKRYGSSQK